MPRGLSTNLIFGTTKPICKMKALVFQAAHEALLYQEMDAPQAREGHQVVRLRAAALNHRDVWISQGLYPGIRPGVVLGSDGMGLADGREVIINPGMNWGDKPSVQGKDYHILGMPSHGTFAEEVLVRSDKIVHTPLHLSPEEAAALPLAGLTAYRALFTKCRLRKGERVLISGVGGGVALFALQFALAAGAEAWVTSGSEWKIEQAVNMGATGGINYKQADWRAFGKESGGFDVIIDSAGGDGFANLVELARPGGRICFYGGTRGKINHLNPQIIFWKQLSIFGSTMGTDAEFRDMVNFVGDHEISPVIDSVYPLKDGNEAFQRMANGLQFGKIVLTI